MRFRSCFLAPFSFASVVLLLSSVPRDALATGPACDISPAASQACIDAIQANGAVVNDVFKDANGLTAQQLPVFGQFFNAYPGCDITSFAGCAGTDTLPYDCPGQYSCETGPNTVANAASFLNTLDHRWWHPCRISDHTLVGGCPQLDTCVADGTPGSYFPWEGLIFDLGGPSNQVAIFATNDHGPQPCESVEYTVYLSDNPLSQEVELNPTTIGIDPNKWNRAVLNKIFTKGWEDVRPADPVGHAACGDTANYAVEQDSFVPVYALPCGVTFRFAAIVAGNDGLDFAECAFDSNEGEIDAVAGLTEDGSAVCNDVDGDLYVDCACVGAPAICDCNDADPNVHPGAPEACDDADLNCDGNPGSCDAGLFCNASICVPPCSEGEFDCPVGSACESTSQGQLCVPIDCTVGGCPPGTVCDDGQCVPACEGVVCPGSQVCVDGQCTDLCANVVCPDGKLCQAGVCAPPCSCFAGDLGCAGLPGLVCDESTDLCVDPACEGVDCPQGDSCEPGSGDCVGFCNPDVTCPDGQKCLEPDGCVPVCTGVVCEQGFECDPATGGCVDRCADVTCFDPDVCVDGECVAGEGGSGGAAQGGGGTGGVSSGGAGSDSGADSGCNCSLERDDRRSGAELLALLGLAAVLARRRRAWGRRAWGRRAWGRRAWGRPGRPGPLTR